MQHEAEHVFGVALSFVCLSICLRDSLEAACGDGYDGRESCPGVLGWDKIHCEGGNSMRRKSGRVEAIVGPIHCVALDPEVMVSKLCLSPRSHYRVVDGTSVECGTMHVISVADGLHIASCDHLEKNRVSAQISNDLCCSTASRKQFCCLLRW